jgi:hypothetical protein
MMQQIADFIAYVTTKAAIFTEILLQFTFGFIQATYRSHLKFGVACIALCESIAPFARHPLHILNTGMDVKAAKHIQQHEEKGIHQHLSSCCRILHNRKDFRVSLPKVTIFSFTLQTFW